MSFSEIHINSAYISGISRESILGGGCFRRPRLKLLSRMPDKGGKTDKRSSLTSCETVSGGDA